MNGKNASKWSRERGEECMVKRYEQMIGALVSTDREARDRAGKVGTSGKKSLRGEDIITSPTLKIHTFT